MGEDDEEVAEIWARSRKENAQAKEVNT